MIERISQSFMKDMRDYLRGQKCGRIIDHKWVQGKDLDDTSEAMDEGCYFEYLLTGALPKSGIKPEPVYQASIVKKNGGKTDGLGVDDMYENYRYIHKLVDAVKAMWEKMGIRIALDKKGQPLRGAFIQKGRHEGTIDIIMEAVRNTDLGGGFVLKKGDRFWLDCKLSGLIKERWSRHGWGDGNWTDEQKEYHGTQGKQYSFLTGLSGGFMVVGKKKKDDAGENTVEVRLFFPTITEDHLLRHLNEGNELFEKLEAHAEFGFKSYPSYKVCRSCPLAEGCPDKHDFPRIEPVEL